MNRLEVIRLEQTNQGAVGVLLFEGKVFCLTLEPDSRDAYRPQIPEGGWELRHYDGTKWKNTLEIVVRDHTAVLFHPGNVEDHTQMCVLLGRDAGYLVRGGRKVRAILDSRRTFKKFQREIISQIQDGDIVQFSNYIRMEGR